MVEALISDQADGIGKLWFWVNVFRARSDELQSLSDRFF